MATVDVMRQPNFNKKDLSISTSDEQTCDMEWETATDVDSVSESSDESISCGASMDCKDDQRLRASTVTVFDWDDTILASSFLQSNGHGLNTTLTCPAVKQQLAQLQEAAAKCISQALEHGPVHIITNAEQGWVQQSAAKWLPKLVPLLERVKVLSARSTYEPICGTNPLQWKWLAFKDVLSEYNVHDLHHVVSVGDSQVERMAVFNVIRQMQLDMKEDAKWDEVKKEEVITPRSGAQQQATKANGSILTKSLKFADRPSIEVLCRQIEVVTTSLPQLYAHDGNLDLKLTVEAL